MPFCIHHCVVCKRLEKREFLPAIHPVEVTRLMTSDHGLERNTVFQIFPKMKRFHLKRLLVSPSRFISLILFRELPSLFDEIGQRGEHGDFTWLETHLLDLQQVKVARSSGEKTRRNKNQHRFTRNHNSNTCPFRVHDYGKASPAPRDIPHQAPAGAGSCCRPWAPRSPPPPPPPSHLFSLASVFSDSPPSSSRSSAPRRSSRSI